MNWFIVLSGGTGSRVGTETPKQYLDIGGKPMMMYCVETAERSYAVDAIVIVAEKSWHSSIHSWISLAGIRKFKGFAEAGTSRQHSVYNALRRVENLDADADDIVIVHDAARPNVSEALLRECVEAMDKADGVMPVLSVKDTIYRSGDGQSIRELLPRDELYAGQAPECYRFGPYFSIHQGASVDQLGTIRGSSEIAFQHGLRIRLIPGHESNYKITTQADLDLFRRQIEKKRNEESK